MVRKISCLLLLIGLFSLISPAFSEGAGEQKQAYFSALPDVPLMENMKEVEGQTFVFDKAEGRVVETLGFLSASSPEKIKQFYVSILLNLGWKPFESNGFRRKDEQLLMKIEEVPQGILVRFQLSPLSR